MAIDLISRGEDAFLLILGGREHNRHCSCNISLKIAMKHSANRIKRAHIG